MDFFGMGPLEILLVLVIALIIFGPGKLPEIGAGLGKAVREFRRATTEMTRDFVREIETAEARPKPPLAEAPKDEETKGS